MLLLFVFIILRVFYIQVFSYKKLNDYATDLWSRNLPLESNRGYIFDKDLILDIIQNLKKLKKQNKDKHSVKDEFNNRYDDKKVYLSPKFLETAIYRIDDTYYVKTREELNGKYDF